MQQIEPGIYRHSKSGKLYEVIGTARYSEDPHQEFVVYKQLYESALRENGVNLPKGTLWIRPAIMFTELIELEGIQVPRFQRIKNS
jgi:hypothetical protein